MKFVCIRKVSMEKVTLGKVYEAIHIDTQYDDIKLVIFDDTDNAIPACCDLCNFTPLVTDGCYSNNEHYKHVHDMLS